MWGVSL